MPKHLPPEVRQRVRALYEGSTLTHAAIAAEMDVGVATVSVWARDGGWMRPPGARTSVRLALAQRATAARLSRNGARPTDVAAVVGCHRRTVGRIAAEPSAPDEAPPRPEPPPHLAELHAALMNPTLHKADAVPLLTRAAAAVGADALLAPDAQAERTARALANLAHCLAALPDHGPHAGAHAPYAGPQTFEETNELLEELAIRLGEWQGEVQEREERERRERLSGSAQDELHG